MLSLRVVTRSALRVISNRPVRLGFAVVAVTFGVLAVATRWGEVASALARLQPLLVLAALVPAILALSCAMVMWRLLLAGLGSLLPARVAARVLFVSQLGKHLPGSVWPMLAQMELGRDHGVPRRRTASAFVLTMLFSLATGLLVATGTLPLAAGARTGAYRWAFLLTPLLLALAHPPVLNPLLSNLLRLVRRPALERPLTGRTTALVALTGMAQWLLNGLHAWILAVALGADPVAAVPLAVGGFALAWCVGFLVVVTPAGLGVREAVLVATLAPVLAPADALVLALVSRVLLTASDLILAGASVTSMRGTRHRTREPVG
ncbi:lysylphosphatidylglycerol synthase transmembrane domain-containing protein [Actinopolymorpha sp. NPDC004070]|uniref:lysylphosphatidylglycerol synthase transmembrane domain-containing protein n=1 Tax=Actinopolymorpha sp. NPDC004070 TaxID=3154548 RepID=UPI0033A3EE66